MGMMKHEAHETICANDEQSLIDKALNDSMAALYSNFRPSENNEMKRLEEKAVKLAEWRKEQNV